MSVHKLRNWDRTTSSGSEGFKDDVEFDDVRSSSLATLSSRRSLGVSSDSQGLSYTNGLSSGVYRPLDNAFCLYAMRQATISTQAASIFASLLPIGSGKYLEQDIK